MERKNARTPRRSALAQSCATVEVTLTARRSQGNGDGLHDVAEHRFGGLGFFLKRSVARTGDDAMGKNGYRELLEVVGQAIAAAIQVGARLRRTLQPQRASTPAAARKLIGFTSARPDL